MEDFNDKIDEIMDDGKKTPKTYVAIVLDSSGSMSNISIEITQGLQSQLDMFVENDKKTPIKLSVVVFADKAIPRFWDLSPVSAKETMEHFTYTPAGMTALCDAVGLVIEKFDVIANNDKEAAFLIVIMSDGQENASQEYHAPKIKEMIEERTATNRWTFTYMGANQDMWEVSQVYGIAKGNTQAFYADSMGVKDAYSTQTMSYANYFNDRIGGVTSTKAFYDATAKEPEQKK